MPMAATVAPYTLFIVDDDIPFNPCEENENLGEMLCFHSHYKLGDKHGCDEPMDFLREPLFW